MRSWENNNKGEKIMTAKDNDWTRRISTNKLLPEILTVIEFNIKIYGKRVYFHLSSNMIGE